MKKLLIIAVLFLSGCAVSSKFTYEQIEETRPVCETDRQCKVMWGAARRWVLDNSDRKIEISDDDHIETYNLGQRGRLAVRVVKEPLAQSDEAYIIIVEPKCNLAGFLEKCIVNDLAMDFNTKVSASINRIR